MYKYQFYALSRQPLFVLWLFEHHFDRLRYSLIHLHNYCLDYYPLNEEEEILDKLKNNNNLRNRIKTRKKRITHKIRKNIYKK